MRRGLRRFIPFAVLFFAVTAQAAAQSTTVIVVRHAETTGAPGDPLLSEAGTARANNLAAALDGAGVKAVYTSQYQRTRLTGAPLAAKLGIEAVVVPASNPMQAHIDAIVAAVKKHEGGTVVVVGHSNTVPMIIRALGGPDVGPIAETQYDNFFTVIVDPAAVRLVRSRY